MLWEPGSHRENCISFLEEINEILLKNGVSNIDSNAIDFLIGEFRQKGNKNSTINRKLSSLFKLLRKYKKSGGDIEVPEFTKLPEKNGRIRFLSADEEESLFAGLSRTDPHYMALAAFLIDTGARIGEAISLRWSDIPPGSVTFWETKANLPRSVPLTARAASIVNDLRTVENRAGRFASIRYANFRNAWLKARKEAGMERDPQIVPHILRHTCASRLAQAGVDIKRIQEFLGHKSLTMTLRYAHLAPMHLRECADALDQYAASREAPHNQQPQGQTSEKNRDLRKSLHDWQKTQFRYNLNCVSYFASN
ncbi:MAG: site-specific integrase [Nitratireductor sp.]